MGEGATKLELDAVFKLGGDDMGELAPRTKREREAWVRNEVVTVEAVLGELGDGGVATQTGAMVEPTKAQPWDLLQRGVVLVMWGRARHNDLAWTAASVPAKPLASTIAPLETRTSEQDPR